MLPACRFWLCMAMAVLTLALGCGRACAADEASAKLRVCVADFRPEAGTVLSEKELVYCKMLQRGVEGELAQWFEVEESTRYGTIAKELANLDSQQAATALGEKAGVHRVLTGLVTKAGSTVMVQCHLVSVPRPGQDGAEVKAVVLWTVDSNYKIIQEDDWVQLLKNIQSVVQFKLTGKEAPPVEQKVSVKVCKVSAMSAGPNCKETETKELSVGSVPSLCNVCKGAPPPLSDDEIRLKIAGALRALDDEKYNEAAKIIDDVVKTAEANGEAWYIRGVTRFFEEKYSEAKQYYLKAIALGYDRASVRDDLANVYLRLSDRNQALEQARKSLELAPGNPWAYHMIGCVTFMAAGKDKGKLRTAADALKKAVELLNTDPQLLDNAANALAQLNELTEAEKYAKASLAAAEKNKEPYPDAYETLSKIYSVKGDKDNAKRYHELYRKATGK